MVWLIHEKMGLCEQKQVGSVNHFIFQSQSNGRLIMAFPLDVKLDGWVEVEQEIADIIRGV